MPQVSQDFNLIQVKEQDGKQLVDARDLYSFLNLKKDFGDWMRKNLKRYHFVEGQDFTTYRGDRLTVGKKSMEYVLTMDMAKELSMVSRTDKGDEARKYFIAVEKKYNGKAENLSPAETLVQNAKYLYEQAKQFAAHEQKLQEHSDKLKVLEAKVDQNSADTGFFTIKAFCSLHNFRITLSEAKAFGFAASRLSRSLDVRIGKVKDAAYGQVNSYQEEVLYEVFDEKFKQ